MEWIRTGSAGVSGPVREDHGGVDTCEDTGDGDTGGIEVGRWMFGAGRLPRARLGRRFFVAGLRVEDAPMARIGTIAKVAAHQCGVAPGEGALDAVRSRCLDRLERSDRGATIPLRVEQARDRHARERRGGEEDGAAVHRHDDGTLRRAADMHRHDRPQRRGPVVSMHDLDVRTGATAVAGADGLMGSAAWRRRWPPPGSGVSAGGPDGRWNPDRGVSARGSPRARVKVSDASAVPTALLLMCPGFHKPEDPLFGVPHADAFRCSSAAARAPSRAPSPACDARSRDR